MSSGKELVVIATEYSRPGMNNMAVHVDKSGALGGAEGRGRKQGIASPAFFGFIEGDAGEMYA